MRRKPAAGTVAALVAEFRFSPRYQGWGAASRKRYEPILLNFRDKNASAPVKAFTRGAIKRALNQIHTTRGPGAARNWLKVMHGLFDYALDLEWIKADPTAGISPPKPDNPDGYYSWTDHELDAFRARWPVGTTARLVFEVLFCTGASIADAVQLGAFNVRLDLIEYRRGKTRTAATMPILPELADVLDGLPSDRPWIATAAGKPRSAKSLTGDMAEWTKAAGLLPGRTCHGLRKARGRVLAEAGCSPHMIAAWLGHKTLAEVARYTATYNRSEAGRQAGEMLSNAPKTPANVSRLKRL